jgi:hypothetical protein
MLAIAFRVPLNIEGPLPILFKKWWSDGYHFWIQMMQICLPFLFIVLCIWWGDANHAIAFLNQNGKDPYQFLITCDGGMPTICQWRWWRYAYHFLSFLYRYDGWVPTTVVHVLTKKWRHAHHSNAFLIKDDKGTSIDS